MDVKKFLKLSQSEQAEQLAIKRSSTFTNKYTFVVLHGAVKVYIKGDYVYELQTSAQTSFLNDKKINLVQQIDIDKKKDKGSLFSFYVSEIVGVGVINFDWSMDGYESFYGDYIYKLIND